MKYLKLMLYTAILAAIAVVFSIIENTFPPILPMIPAAKIGLANLITVICLFSLPNKYTIQMLTIRLLVATFLLGTASTFLYSLSGSILSFCAMLIVKQLGPNKVSIIGISSVGGFFHNVGQLIVACIIAQSWSIMLYLPILSIIGLLTGLFNGICGNFLLIKTKPLQIMSANKTDNIIWIKKT